MALAVPACGLAWGGRIARLCSAPVLATTVLILAVGTGCGDHGTGPAAIPFKATATELAAVKAAVDDAGSRLLGSLTDRQFAGQLGPLVNALSQDIGANRADQAAPDLSTAQQALAQTAATAPAADAPDRSAIDLALTQVALLVAR